jgi:hypothetical protein
MTVANEEARARAGATFMDVNCVGWPEKIDRDRLHMAKCAGCIVGQTKGNFFDGCVELGLSLEQATAFGFNAESLAVWDEAVRDGVSLSELKHLQPAIDAEYADLKTAWLSEIALRLGTPEAEEARVEASPVDAGEAWGAL